MSKQYVPDLVRISLNSVHWQTLRDLAIENKSTTGELVSDWLEETLQKVIDDADLIDSLQETIDP